MKIRIAIYDDESLRLAPLYTALQACKQFSIKGIFYNKNELLNVLQKESVNILIATCYEGGSCETIVDFLREKHDDLAVITVVNLKGVNCADPVIPKENKSYLDLRCSTEKMIRVIKRAYKGEHFTDPCINVVINKPPKPAIIPTLTSRETDILKLIVQAHTSEQIGEKCNISKRTVENHRINLLQKLGTKNTAGLVKYAMDNGLI